MKHIFAITTLSSAICLNLIGSDISNQAKPKIPNLKLFALNEKLNITLYTRNAPSSTVEAKYKEPQLTEHSLSVNPQTRCNIFIKNSHFDSNENIQATVNSINGTSVLPAYIKLKMNNAYAFALDTPHGKKLIQDLVDETNGSVIKTNIPNSPFKELKAQTLYGLHFVEDSSGTLCHHYFSKHKTCPPTVPLVSDSDDAARYDHLKKAQEELEKIHYEVQ